MDARKLSELPKTLNKAGLRRESNPCSIFFGCPSSHVKWLMEMETFLKQLKDRYCEFNLDQPKFSITSNN